MKVNKTFKEKCSITSPFEDIHVGGTKKKTAEKHFNQSRGWGKNRPLPTMTDECTYFVWYTFSPFFLHTYVMLGGSAYAWHWSSAFWDMLTQMLCGGTTITGGPSGKQIRKNIVCTQSRVKTARSRNIKMLICLPLGVGEAFIPAVPNLFCTTDRVCQ